MFAIWNFMIKLHSNWSHVFVTIYNFHCSIECSCCKMQLKLNRQRFGSVKVLSEKKKRMLSVRISFLFYLCLVSNQLCSYPLYLYKNTANLTDWKHIFFQYYFCSWKRCAKSCNCSAQLVRNNVCALLFPLIFYYIDEI